METVAAKARDNPRSSEKTKQRAATVLAQSTNKKNEKRGISPFAVSITTSNIPRFSFAFCFSTFFKGADCIPDKQEQQIPVKRDNHT
ncbi:MAG: hypothetical protein E6326_19850 [Enterobacter roggenkampii]|nr:hypothetical protein [Enterobacter roggenkampii]